MNVKAPNYWIEYTADWRLEPMAFWVHVEADGKPWRKAASFSPPAPEAVPHKGYAVICVEIDRYTLRFSSTAQLEQCIQTLSAKPMPTTLRLRLARGTGAGLNSHWLSRLPTRIKTPRSRERCVKKLRAVLADYSRDTHSPT